MISSHASATCSQRPGAAPASAAAAWGGLQGGGTRGFTGGGCEGDQGGGRQRVMIII
jgi:hypothetical protein